MNEDLLDQVRGEERRAFPSASRIRARLAVAVLNGTLPAARAGKLFGLRRSNAFPAATWSSLRKAVEAGLARVEWLGGEDPAPATEDGRSAPRRFLLDPAKPAPPSPAGKKSDTVRQAIGAFAGNFTAREIHERVVARHPEADVSLNNVCMTIAQMIQEGDLHVVATEERDGSRAVRVYCQRPDAPPTKHRKGIRP
jgi:hypothetical protein